MNHFCLRAIETVEIDVVLEALTHFVVAGVEERWPKTAAAVGEEVEVGKGSVDSLKQPVV